MNRILTGWNFFRVVRLLIGIAIAAHGLDTGDKILVGLGFLFGILAFANIGCCGPNGCSVDIPQSDKSRQNENEELGIKK